MLKNCHVFRFIDDLMQRVTVGNLKIITNNAKLQVKGLILKLFDSHPYRERGMTLLFLLRKCLASQLIGQL